MKDFLVTLLHLAVTTAKLCGSGGVRAVIAENLLLKHQLIVLRRARRRAPNLTQSDRLLCVKLGARRRRRRKTISCCLRTRFSAMTARTPPVPHSLATATAKCNSVSSRFVMRESA